MQFNQTLQRILQRFRQSGRAIRLVWNSGPIWMILDTVLAFCIALPPLLLLVFTKLIVDKVTIDLFSSNANPDQIFAELVPIIVGILVTLLTMTCLQSLDRYVTLIQSQKLEKYVFGLVQQKSIELDLEYYENSEYQDIMHMARSEALSRPRALVTKLADLAQAILSGIAVVAILLAFNPIVVLILALSVLPGVVLRLKISRRQYRWNKENVFKFRLADYLSGLLINTNSAKEIRLNSLGTHVRDRYERIRETLNHDLRSMGITAILIDFGIQASSALAVICVYGYVIYLTVHHQATIGQMVMYYQLFQRGQGILQGITSSFTGFYENSLYAAAVFDFMDLPAKLAAPRSEIAVSFPDPIREGIRFENVTFQYPRTASPAFKDLNLFIPAGQVIALVGVNGAGKTTLIKLLCRLYDPTVGRITVDGIDLREIAVDELRRHIGVIFQDYLGYFLSAKDNIWFGNVDQPPDGVEAAATLAEVHDKLASLQHGYDTNLGRWLEGGAQLSGGEWQKVALSRVFFRNAPIIVLDEPTSAIDALAEYQLFLKFRDVVRGKTAVLISHRLTTVQMADCIYILENGQISEGGTHAELLRADKTYAKLFKLQAQYYQFTNHDDDLNG